MVGCRRMNVTTLPRLLIGGRTSASTGAAT